MAAISDPPPRPVRPLPIPRTCMKYSVPPPPTSNLHAEELLVGTQNCATQIPPSIHGSSACAKNHFVHVFPTTVTPVLNLSSSVTGLFGASTTDHDISSISTASVVSASEDSTVWFLFEEGANARIVRGFQEAGPLIQKNPDVRTTAHATERDAIVALQEYELRLNVTSISSPPAPPPSPSPVHPCPSCANLNQCSTSMPNFIASLPGHALPMPSPHLTIDPPPGVVCLSFVVPSGQALAPMTVSITVAPGASATSVAPISPSTSTSASTSPLPGPLKASSSCAPPRLASSIL